MMRTWLSLLLFLAAGLSAQSVTPGSAITASDGGMWTFDQLPKAAVKDRHGFEITDAWVDHVRLSSLRVSTGGSASFVSSKGLVLTNHHVALELVNNLSSQDLDLTTHGFYAQRLEDELPCPGASLDQLLQMEDVTEQVSLAMKDAASAEEANAKKQAAFATLSKERSEKSGHKVDIVSLYGGGKYMAYTYKVFSDVRLVFAPEMRVAYYGGDYDNFTYPRYCLDMAFLRAYENGQPVDSSAHFLKWSPVGPAEGDLVFVSGNPGSTARLWPIARLAHERDSYTPGVIELLRTREMALTAFAALGDSERIQVLDELFGVRNSLKAFQGHLGGLLDASIWQRKVDEEDAFRKAAAGDADVEAALQVYERTRVARDAAFPNLIFARLDGDLGTLAVQVARLGRFLAMPESERPAAYRGEALKSLIQRLSSGQAIDPRLAELRLRANFESAQKVLRNDHPYVKAALLPGKSAAESAKAAIAQTVLLRPAGLKALLEGGPSAIQSSTDPILTVARIADPLRTEASGRWQAADAEEAEAGAVLAQARFRIYGSSLYPDATFTLRLSMGVCKGYELGTTLVPWTSTFYGLYARNAEMGNKEPFDLPQKWKAAERSLDLSTPYNFVSTNDIIGGNSGSPVISKNLELVGLIFDGNIQSLPNRYLYLDEVCRSVSVHSKGMTHALERVYKAYRVLDELGL